VIEEERGKGGQGGRGTARGEGGEGQGAVKGVCIALCCHHLAKWSDYVGQAHDILKSHMTFSTVLSAPPLHTHTHTHTHIHTHTHGKYTRKLIFEKVWKAIVRKSAIYSDFIRKYARLYTW
jgi:hypothetical protein